MCVISFFCEKCGVQYIGETSNSMRERFYGHKGDIIHKRPTPISTHFNLPEHNIHTHLKIIVIESGFTNDYKRKNWESFFIAKFHSLVPNCLNVYTGPLYHLMPKGTHI